MSEKREMVLPDLHTKLHGSHTEGWKIALQWAADRVEQERAFDQLPPNLSAEEAKAQMPICRTMDEIGFTEAAQRAAHLMALNQFAHSVMQDLMIEVRSHYAPEMAAMLAQGQAEEAAAREAAQTLPEGHVVVEHLGTH